MLLVQALILIAFLAFWEFEAGKSKQSAFMFGSPSAIGHFLWQMMVDGSLLRDISVTGLETLLGFLIGNLIGTFATQTQREPNGIWLFPPNPNNGG